MVDGTVEKSRATPYFYLTHLDYTAIDLAVGDFRFLDVFSDNPGSKDNIKHTLGKNWCKTGFLYEVGYCGS